MALTLSTSAASLQPVWPSAGTDAGLLGVDVGGVGMEQAVSAVLPR